ncbi:PREDICTED: slit homolog 1 protein-like [Dufourea novaeangliae]|uniref:Slit like protein 2 protein n=1 Tax=Dufourea novaeangliae TaxID=178035 RepID=A0A154PJK6_DUFNO|nr:PREDICTED: slit homolog 1 protein-like [Dufourea novaeangliae]KZC11390.1 Slit like protein 2 protein [Dufourea novaeangliae]
MHQILLWALVALIGRVDCKCSIAPIADDERSIAYACTHGDLNDLDEISSEAEWIEFSVSRFLHIPDNAFGRFRNLRRLSFYNCHVNFIAPDAFAGLNRLEWMIFHGTGIHVARTAWFRPLDNLRKLILDRCGLVHIEPDVFRVLPRLEVLGLRDNDLDCLPTEELAYLRALRSVRIDGNPWLCECRQRLDRYLRDRSINQEVECSREIHLCRRYQCMTHIGFPILPSTFTTQQLTNYNRERTTIRGSQFQTNVFTSLDRLPDKTTWIEISGLTMEKLPRYGFFRFGNSLRSLDLNDCRIQTIETGAFAGLHRLQRLSLVGNHFTAVGADWFRDLLNLQQLILQRNDIEQIERTSLWHLGDSLRHLDLRDNRLRCVTIEELAELKKLERLDATGNPWLCNCRRNLQSFLTQKNVGFEINAGRCYENENEIPDVVGGWRQQQSTVDTSITTGRVHYTSFEDSIKQSNLTIVRPRPSSPPVEIHVVTPSQSAPIYTGRCYPEKNDERSRSIYTCRAITSTEDLLVIPQTVHTIRVILSKIKTIPHDAFTRFDGYLSRLEFRDCGVEKIEPRAFSKLYNLEYLSLRNNQLDAVDAEMLEGLSNLRHLDLSHNNIYRITNDAFDDIPYLTSLDVSENSMNCIGVEYMAKRLRYLSTLNVANNPWSCLCGTKLADFLNTRGIRYDKHSLLLREDCYATAVPAITTVAPATTPNAPTWNETIEGTCIPNDDNVGIRYRCVGGNLLLLQSLPPEVAAIEFHEGHLPRLPAGCFSKFQNLRELVITNSGLTTVEQGAFDGLNKLENLTIQDNPLEMIGSSWFPLENLEKLDLRGNSIKYIAPGAFRRLNRLTYLNLEGNDLKCIFTSDLNEMPDVYVVEFSGNPLKWRCRVELEQFLEARKIRFVRIENSCEGKKLVRNLLLQNKTDGSFDCPSDCSAATNTYHGFFILLFVLPLFATRFY